MLESPISNVATDVTVAFSDTFGVSPSDSSAETRVVEEIDFMRWYLAYCNMVARDDEKTCHKVDGTRDGNLSSLTASELAGRDRYLQPRYDAVDDAQEKLNRALALAAAFGYRAA